jgi:hypothetical protein
MLRNILSCIGMGLLASACAIYNEPGRDSAPGSEMSNYQRALGTVDALDKAGNEQIAIDRMTQLLGDPAMSDEQMAGALYRRALLRYGEGNDVEGAITDTEEISNVYPGSEVADKASALLLLATQERDLLTSVLEDDTLGPMRRFETLFRLGRHQEATDMIMASGLEPEMGYLLDMYQIGYLCDGDNVAGPTFELVEPDGTPHTVQLCDLS